MKKLTPLVLALMLSIAPSALATHDTPPPVINGDSTAAAASAQTGSPDHAASIAAVVAIQVITALVGAGVIP